MIIQGVFLIGPLLEKMRQHIRKGYLSHRKSAKTQTSLRKSAVSPDPLLFADM